MPGETLLNQRYELVAQQGSGGMSVIYRALDRSLGRMVAVKILRPNLTKQPELLEKFQQEARTFAMMSHPNIVTVHDVGSDGATHYIVMEMVDGDDLKKLIKTQGALDLDKALDLGIQICAGIGFAHRSRMVHADVKPHNILINRDGIVKVTDFGIAQALSDSMPQTRSKVVWGSPHYFAPEQARGEKPSPASDVYSIGIVLFEMFTGSLPYVGSSQRELALAHLRADVPQAIERKSELPPELSNVIAKVMSKRPNDRYKHADQLGHILRQIRDRQRAPSRGSQAAAPMPRRSQQTCPARAAPSPVPPIPLRREPIAAAAMNARPDDDAIPSPPNPLFKPDGSINVEATGGYSGPFMPQRRAKDEGADIVTILLILLAFVAVAGLVPLYLLGVFPLL